MRPDLQHILITGGAGFIGTNLSRVLIESGYRVSILDNLSPQIHGERPQMVFPEGVAFFHGDVRNREDWKKALQEVQAVIHLAAETGTGQSMYEIERYVDININGTALLLDLLVNEPHQVRKVLVASSRAIYGEGKYKCAVHGEVYPSARNEEQMIRGVFEPQCPYCGVPVVMLPTDEESRIHPVSLYGITKQNQEQMVLNICKSIGIAAVACRYQNVYGPGQSLKNPYTGILSIFSTQILNGNDINIFEDGEESRDFVFISDVVNATVLGLESDKADHQIYNVGTGVATSVLKVAETLKELYRAAVDIQVAGNFRLGDIRHNQADIRKIKMDLGYQPQVSFEDGIRKFVAWVLEQELPTDAYEESMQQLKEKGLLK